VSTEATENVANETVIYKGHPSWRSMLDFHVAGLVLAALGGLIGKVAANSWTIAGGVFAAVLLISIVIGAIRRSTVGYEISDRRLYIRRGIFSRSEQHTTIDRIQNVEAHQSFLERLLGIGTIEFDTAATDDCSFAFAGIARPKRVVAAVNSAEDAKPAAEAPPGEAPPAD
jgi:uncharacterized membrane protein YdbT with pleckstrin-like domain